jgi:cytoskeletal protein CcmA (bactofilin family)
MWKRDQAVQPSAAQPPSPTAPPSPAKSSDTPAEPAQPNRRRETPLANIGQSVVIHGDLHGSEDLVIEGQVEGTIELKDNTLTVGPHGRVKAKVSASTVIVLGALNGQITTSDKVDIREGGQVDGDIVSPRVAIADGATFCGSIDMKPKATKGLQPGTAAAKTVPETKSAPTSVGEVQPLVAAPAH